MHADENELDLHDGELADIEEFDEFGEPMPSLGKPGHAGDEFGDEDIDIFADGEDM